MKSLLLSMLARNELASDRDEFVRAHRGPWLVWEVGPWSPPRERGTLMLSMDRARRESSGDALALEVAPRAGRARFEGVRLGRGPENDLVVDDGTLSRAHLLLREEEGAWILQDLRSSNGTRVDGRAVEDAVRLEPGTQIEAGSVRLTFYDGAGLYQRLKRSAV